MTTNIPAQHRSGSAVVLAMLLVSSLNCQPVVTTTDSVDPSSTLATEAPIVPDSTAAREHTKRLAVTDHYLVSRRWASRLADLFEDTTPLHERVQAFSIVEVGADNYVLGRGLAGRAGSPWNIELPNANGAISFEVTEATVESIKMVAVRPECGSNCEIQIKTSQTDGKVEVTVGDQEWTGEFGPSELVRKRLEKAVINFGVLQLAAHKSNGLESGGYGEWILDGSEVALGCIRVGRTCTSSDWVLACTTPMTQIGFTREGDRLTGALANCPTSTGITWDTTLPSNARLPHPK